MENMERIFQLNRRMNTVTGNLVDFDDEFKKNIIQLEGGAEMQDLFKHVGKVLPGDSYAQAMEKIKAALRGRANRTTVMFKLFTGMSQAIHIRLGLGLVGL